MADHDLILRLEYALNRSGDPWGWVVNVTPCPCRATGMPDNDCRDEAVVDLGCGEPVRHSHYRCVPCGESGAVVLVECEPGRGAFAVTIADAAWPNREALRG